MTVNLFFVLLPALITLMFTGSVKMAAAASLVVVSLLTLYHLIKEFLYALSHQNYTYFRKKAAEKGLVMLFLVLLFALSFYLYLPLIQEKLVLYRLNKAMRAVPASLIKKAVQDLKKHPNEPKYCALFFFPDLNAHDPAAIARYLVYYHFENTHCSDFWAFGQSHCGYLENLNSNKGHPVDLLSNILVCRYAQSDAFSLKLYDLGGGHVK